MRKRISLLLMCFCLTIGLIPAMTSTVRASTNGVTRDQAVAWVNNKVQTGAGGSTECVYLVYGYYNYLGQATPGGNATDFAWKSLPSGWNRYGNSTDPQAGDIVVWQAGYTNYNGYTYNQWGHVGIITAVNGSTYTYVDYNGDAVWGAAAKSRSKQLHDFSCVIRPDFASSQPVPWLPARNLGSDFYAYIYNPQSNCNLENRNGNVQTASISRNDPRQIWHFQIQNDGQYKITSLYDGRCIDAADWGTGEGTNIQVCMDSNNAAQRWWFCGEDNGNRYYVHPPYISDQSRVWDVNGGSDSPGANIQLWRNHYQTNGGTFNEAYIRAQTFQVNKISNINSVLAYDLGSDFYARISYNGSYLETTGMATENGNNMDIQTKRTLNASDTKQLWHFTRQSDGSYTIVNEYNDWYMDIPGANAYDGARVRTWIDDSSITTRLGRRWYILYSPGDSTYRIVSATQYPSTLYSLDVPVSADGMAAPDGMTMTVCRAHQNSNQKFTISKVAYTKPSAKPNPPTDLTYRSTDAGIVFTWDKVSGISRYLLVIEDTNSGKNVLNAYVDGTSYTYPNLPDGKYKITVQSVNSAGVLSDIGPVMSLTLWRDYTIRINSTEGGTASGGGTYRAGTAVTVRAYAQSGYRFVRWTENGKEVSASADYTFTVSKDRTLTAVFEPGETPPEACAHDYKNTVTSPACTEQGYTTHTCSKCGESYKDNYKAALGHRYGAWVITTPATATTEGRQERACSRCGVKESSVIPATGGPLHGTVTISASGVLFPADDGALVVPDQTITLRATPDTGYRLQSIQVVDANGRPLQLSGSGNTYAFKMPSCDVTVNAVFSKT